MAASLRLRLTTTGQSSYRGKLSLEICLKGTSSRTYILVKNLNNPDYSSWDKKNQLFIGRDNNISYNNNVANNLYKAVEALKDNPDFIFKTPQDLKQAYEQGLKIQAKKDITFGELVTNIEEYEYNQGIGSNYQAYRNLKNKLYSTDAPTFNDIRIADIPVKDISNDHFKAFFTWLCTKHPNYGCKNLMSLFHASFQRASNIYNIEINHILSFKWRGKIKEHKKHDDSNLEKELKNEITTISVEEFKRFSHFDLSQIAPTQAKKKRLLEIYFDMTLFMYYTLSRPADVIRLKWGTNYKEDTKKLIYRVFKLRDKDKSKIVDMTLTKKIIDIINKYKGQNRYGYIFPLPMNEIDWDSLTDWQGKDRKIERYWDAKRNHTIGSINNYLKKIQAIENFDVPKLHLYVFRHSAITHSIRTYEKSVQYVAEIAGTSVEKINNYYLGANESTLKTPLGDDD